MNVEEGNGAYIIHLWDLFKITKEYLTKNLDKLFLDFQDTVNNVLENVSNKLVQFYIMEPENTNKTLYRFGLIPSNDPNAIS